MESPLSAIRSVIIPRGGARCLILSWPILAFSVFVISLLLWHPIQVWSQTIEGEPSEQQRKVKLTDCYLNNDARPSGASSVDTTTVNSIAKIIVLEKITFACKSPPSNEYVLVDVNMQAKLIDGIESQVVLARSIEITTCVKDINGSILECVTEVPTKDLPSTSCSVKKPYQRSPTVVSSTSHSNASMPVERVEVDSDIFSCRNQNGEQILKNVVTLSESFEKIQDAKPLKKSTESLSCATDIKSAIVLGCRFQKVL